MAEVRERLESNLCPIEVNQNTNKVVETNMHKQDKIKRELDRNPKLQLKLQREREREKERELDRIIERGGFVGKYLELLRSVKTLEARLNFTLDSFMAVLTVTVVIALLIAVYFMKI